MNEIRAWLVEQGYTVLSELIETDGSWILQLQSGELIIPVSLMAGDVERPQLGISAIEVLFKALLD
jgi:hypothetical protein